VDLRADGSLLLRSRFKGLVRSVGGDAIRIRTAGSRRPTIVRYLLPAQVGLRHLVALTPTFEIDIALLDGRPPTVDARIFHEGRLLLWAHSGTLPADRDSPVAPVRLAHTPAGDRLVFVRQRRVTGVAEGHVADVHTDVGRFRAFAVRVADEASFVLVRLS